jgi:hypothetical protein
MTYDTKSPRRSGEEAVGGGRELAVAQGHTGSESKRRKEARGRVERERERKSCQHSASQITFDPD